MENKALCPSCVKPTQQTERFCSHCGAPISYMATIDPIQETISEGLMYQRVSQNPRSAIVVIGACLLFGVFSVLILIFTIREIATDKLSTYQFQKWVGLIGVNLFSVCYIVLLSRTIRNYYKFIKSRD